MDEVHSVGELNGVLQSKSVEKGIPVMGGFELTPRCNLRCRMCYVREDVPQRKKELSADQWIRLGKEAADAGALNVYLTGGEPLLRSDFRTIYEGFCMLGFRLTLFTNGTLLDDACIRWLASIPPAAVDITLYGASPETYKNLCGSAEAYAKAIHAVDLLQEHNIYLRIKTTVVKENLRDYEKIQSFAASRRLDLITSSVILGHRTEGADSCRSERLTPEELCDFLHRDLAPSPRSLSDPEELRQLYRDMPPMNCLAGKSSFFINWQGLLTPCTLMDAIYAEPLQIGFKEAWKKIREDTRRIPEPESCTRCDKKAFCCVCPAKTYLETGSFEKHAEYFCALAGLQEEKFLARKQSQIA